MFHHSQTNNSNYKKAKVLATVNNKQMCSERKMIFYEKEKLKKLSKNKIERKKEWKRGNERGRWKGRGKEGEGKKEREKKISEKMQRESFKEPLQEFPVVPSAATG